jgi:uncharacterized protein YgbK (DUF1537 family)
MMAGRVIAAVADDFTGATDVAMAFRRAGLSVGIVFGVPDDATLVGALDALVIALKSQHHRCEGCRGPNDVFRALAQGHGFHRFYFKYCSTFDSSPRGNIGPVADALADRLDASVVIVTPASPVHDRTVYEANLFVTGAAGLAAALVELRGAGPIGNIESGNSAGSTDSAEPINNAIPINSAMPIDDSSQNGPAAVIAGSCSARTLHQVAVMVASNPSYRLDALLTPNSTALAHTALEWYDSLDSADGAPLIYSSLPQEQLRKVQDELGSETAAALVEGAFGLVAHGLVERGVKRLVVAGGETSGSVTTALGVTSGIIGGEAAPGVPWILVEGDHPLALLLKSGNFGEADLLVAASQTRSTPGE